ncbi:MAG: hypothetical protein ACTHOK_10280 [Nocardioidaceae bacterium]
MRKTIAAVPVALAAVTVSLAAPAYAATLTVRDPHDLSHGVDLRSVRVTNGDRDVVVVTTHSDLRRDPSTGSAGAVYVDTDPADAGPEFVFVGGYYEGTDYRLLHTEGFGHRRWGAPVAGSYRMSVDYAADRVRMRMSRSALGSPGKVRVAVRVSGTRPDGSSAGVVDWLGEPRGFTRWVAQG